MAGPLIQHKSTATVTGGVISVTLDAAPGTGRLLVACLRSNTLIAGITAPSGWAPANTDDNDDASFSVGEWFKVAAAGESSTVSFTVGNVTSRLHVVEFAVVQATPLDKAPAATDPAGGGLSCACGSTGTLSQPDEVAVAVVSLNGASGGGVSWDSGFTDITVEDRLLVGYKLTTVTTALNPTASWTTTRGRDGVVATFKGGISPAGTITPAGAVTRTTSKPTTGTTTPAGAVVKTASKSLVAAVTPAGVLIRTIVHALLGAITPSGLERNTTTKKLTASTTPAGLVAKTSPRNFAGTIASGGQLTRATLKATTGSVAPTGTVRRSVAKLLAAIVSPAGPLAKTLARGFAGTVAPGGVLVSTVARQVPIRFFDGGSAARSRDEGAMTAQSRDDSALTATSRLDGTGP